MKLVKLSFATQFTEEAAEELHARGERLREGVNQVFEECGARFTATGGVEWAIYPQRRRPR